MAPDGAARSVVVDDVSVTYRVYSDRSQEGRSQMRSRAWVEVEALKHVSLTARPGDSIGVVGSNGSGKSTLLAAIAGLLPTQTGKVLVRSQPALLGVSAALKPELSGRRNIVIGALAMGIDIDEIRSELPAIAEFTELGDAIDRPMRTYSSGMRARLAFSVATLRVPDILLIDEALAVGDRSFRNKSLGRIRSMQASAGTVFMVTHNLGEIRATCTRAVWIEAGELRADGDVDDVLALYESS